MEYKPCPFCGDTPGRHYFGTDESGKWGFVECVCGARGPDVRTNYARTEEWAAQAVDMWNERKIKCQKSGDQ